MWVDLPVTGADEALWSLDCSWNNSCEYPVSQKVGHYCFRNNFGNSEAIV